MESKGASLISSHNPQRKFFHWAMKWFHAGQTDDITIKPDAPELACFLQTIGFQLREFDKQEELLNSVNKNTKSESLKVIIECSSSKMRAVMELDDITCHCPNQDEAKDASFWSISGTGPLGSTENMNKVVETGSNLLPSISKGDASVVRDVTQHLFKLIRNIPDLNQNTDPNLNLSDNAEGFLKPLSETESTIKIMRRHTQHDFNTGRCRSLDTLIESGEVGNEKLLQSALTCVDPISGTRNRSSSDSLRKNQNELPSKADDGRKRETRANNTHPIGLPKNPPLLQRQKTFDMMDVTDSSNIDGEPRPSPPKISSSPVPVPQLCTSLGQISLQSEGKDIPLVEFLLQARANLETALKMLNTWSGASSTVLEDTNLMPPPSKSYSFRLSPGENSRPESSCSLPVNSGLRNTGLPRPSSARRNVEASFRRSSDRLKSPADKKSLHQATRSQLLQRRSLGGGRIPSPKPFSPKADTPRPGVSGLSSSTSSMSRMIISAKRRVSPDPKNLNSFEIHNKPKNSPNTSGLKTTSSLGLRNKLQSNVTVSPKSPLDHTANKFGFIKKKA